MKRTAILLIGTLALLGVPGAASEPGREFVGFYKTADVVDAGDDVSLTLKVRVFNYSGADVPDATIRLKDPLIPETAYGSFLNVGILPGESVRLSGTFTIPRREYEHWQQGAAPSLRVSYKDSSGNAVERTIELARALLPDEEEQ